MKIPNQIKNNWKGGIFFAILVISWVLIYTSDRFDAAEDSFVFAYLEKSSELISGFHFKPIKGEYVNDPIVGWIVDGDKIVYQLKKPRIFLVAWSISVSSDRPDTIVFVAVNHNGESHQSMSTKSGVVIGIDVIKIEKGDTIQLVFTTDKSGDIVKFNSLQTTIVAL